MYLLHWVSAMSLIVLWNTAEEKGSYAKVISAPFALQKMYATCLQDIIKICLELSLDNVTVYQ